MAEQITNIPQFYKVTAQDILDYKALDTVGKAIILNKIAAIKEDAIFIFPTSDGTNGESIGRASELLKVLGAVDEAVGEVVWDELLGTGAPLNLTRNASLAKSEGILGAKKEVDSDLDINLDSEYYTIHTLHDMIVKIMKKVEKG